MKYAFFDLDGTLNGNKARVDFVPEDVTVNENWLGWHKAFKLEPMNRELITAAQALYKAGFGIGVISNRDQSLSAETYRHLNSEGFPEYISIFRQAKDHQHPSDWKFNTVQNAMLFLPNGSIVMHFDDDKKSQDKLVQRFAHSDLNYIPMYVNF